MVIDPITAGLDLAGTVINKIWPDKTEAERAQLAARWLAEQRPLLGGGAAPVGTDIARAWQLVVNTTALWLTAAAGIAACVAALTFFIVTLNAGGLHA